MKQFDEWGKKKNSIHQLLKNKWVVKREVWWCTLGVNIGSEEDGKGVDFLRPVLVIRVYGFTSVVVVPLTTTAKTGPFYFNLGKVGDEGGISTALLSQMRLIDTKRFVEKIGKIDAEKFKEIKKAIQELLL